MERRDLRREPLKVRWRWYGVVIGCVLAAYAVVWMFTEKTPFMHSPYCSYALQARRWLEGHLDLGEDYPWLELAIYKGKYFVSFPPLPTLIVMPFVALFGVDGTPEYLVATVMSLVAAVQLLKLFDLYCEDRRTALVWALLATIGSNFLLIGYNGDVWLLAQTAAFMFTAAALYYAATDAEADGKWPLLWLACAVGCRPLNIVYLPLVAWLLREKFRKNGLGLWGAVKKHWAWLIAPALVGGFYMALNQLRFDSPFQFGHDYLPEFTESPDHVQFSLSSIPWNFTDKLVRLPGPAQGWLDAGVQGRLRVLHRQPHLRGGLRVPAAAARRAAAGRADRERGRALDHGRRACRCTCWRCAPTAAWAAYSGACATPSTPSPPRRWASCCCAGAGARPWTRCCPPRWCSACASTSWARWRY